MKIRACFVSNSSSSSFVFIGRKICSLSESNKYIKLDKDRSYVTIGKFLNEGYDAAELNQEMFDHIIKNLNKTEYKHFHEADLYEVFSGNEFQTSIECKKLNSMMCSEDEHVHAVHIDADYDSSMSLEDLKKNYE